MTRPAPPGRGTGVALGVSAAILAYAGSLVLQRAAPAVKEALTVTVMTGVRVTYYLRVILSLVVGVVAAVMCPRFASSPRALALGTALAIAIGVILVCAFP